MCDFCKTVYHSHEKHEQAVCPLANALTCSCCKRRDHTTLKCPNRDWWKTRVPEYVEQLIPFELRRHHQIPESQMTPFSKGPNPDPIPCHHVIKDSSIKCCSICRPAIEIPEDKDSENHTGNIRATLASNNFPSSSVKENKKLMEAVGSMTNRKVIYLKKDRFIKHSLIQNQEAMASIQADKKKPAFKLRAKALTAAVSS